MADLFGCQYLPCLTCKGRTICFVTSVNGSDWFVEDVSLCKCHERFSDVEFDEVFERIYEMHWPRYKNPTLYVRGHTVFWRECQRSRPKDIPLTPTERRQLTRESSKERWERTNEAEWGSHAVMR